jgi:hypothetical protein
VVLGEEGYQALEVVDAYRPCRTGEKVTLE